MAVTLSLKPTQSLLASLPPGLWGCTVALNWQELKDPMGSFSLRNPSPLLFFSTHILCPPPSGLLAFLILGLEYIAGIYAYILGS